MNIDNHESAFLPPDRICHIYGALAACTDDAPYCLKCKKEQPINQMLKSMAGGKVFRCSDKTLVRTQAAKAAVDRHDVSKMTNIPIACLNYLRPKNEDSEKEKFKHFWQLSIDTPNKGKIYNPKFTYQDARKA